MEIGNKPSRFNWKLGLILWAMNAVLFIGISCVFDYFLSGDMQTLESYLYRGVFFGLYITGILLYLSRKSGLLIATNVDISPILDLEEQIEAEGPANLMYEKEGVGGKIFLTDRNLIFAPDQYNSQIGNRHIGYQNILEISKRRNGLILDNVIRINTIEGKVFDFVVNDRETWIDKLNEQMLKYELNNLV